MSHNPFVYGKPVCNDSFFGRQNSLNLLWSRLISAVQPSSCSIVGETRIGKSSIKEQFLHNIWSKPGEKNVFPIDLDVSSVFKTGTTTDFYRQFFGYLLEEMNSLEGIDKLALVRATEPDVPWPMMVRNIKKFLKSVRAAGIFLLIVMDEFDYMERHFEFDPQGWNLLRSLAYDFDSPIVYLTLSRRPLNDIEKDLKISSNFAGIFGEPIRLRLLRDAQALDLITKPVERQGKEWPPHVPALISGLTGGHPYMTQYVCFHLYEQLDQGQSLSSLTSEALITQFSEKFGSLFEMLRERLVRKDMFTTLLKVTYNVPIDTEIPKLEELVQLGYLVQLSNGVYQPFSPIFEQYLKSFRFTEELWPTLGRVERALRRMVEARCRDKFKEQWLEEIAAKNKVPGKDHSIVDEWRFAQEKEQKNVAVSNVASLSLIDYSYIDQLRQLISQQSDLFYDFLGPRNSFQRGQLEEAFKLLSGVRNPSAHFRPIKSEAATNAHIACEFLLKIIPSEYKEETS